METSSDCWSDLHAVIAAGIDRVLLYGHPGTGKTFAALNYGHPHGAYRLTCTEDLTSADVTGMWMPGENGSFDFREGPAILAWRGTTGRGGRLVVDEGDRASADVLSQLLAMTDSPESARWRNPQTHEDVRPGPDFSVFMTTNVEDPDDIPAALRDRFPVAICIDRPPTEALERLSDDLRPAALHGAGDQRLPLRSLYAFDQLRQHHDEALAARLVFRTQAPAVLDALAIARVGQ